ncbi:MAG: hypothetical protein IPP17_22185 [Bacteroidetes bacterium]|nr:hypothetical protein [Bacteroidota bacterium]
MLELLLFLLAQFLINGLIRWIGHARLSYVFGSLAVLLFGILILIYPTLSWQIQDLLFPPAPGAACANLQVGGAIFQWALGIPLVIFLQKLLNDRMFHLDKLLERFEKSGKG